MRSPDDPLSHHHPASRLRGDALVGGQDPLKVERIAGARTEINPMLGILVLFVFEGRTEINPMQGTLALVVFYVVISFAFVKITQRGFRDMEAAPAPR